MPTERIIRAPRLPDSVVLDITRDLMSGLETDQAILQLSQNINFPINRAKELGLSESTFLIFSATVEEKNRALNVQFRRGISTGNWDTRQASTLYDEFRIIFYDNPQATPERAARTILLIETKSAQSGVASAPSGDIDTTEFVRAQFAQLQALIVKMASEFDDRQVALDEHRKELEKRNEEARTQREQAFDAKRIELDLERQSLEGLRKELDDRDHMHVRRQLREKITNDLRQRLKQPIASEKANQIRMSVVYLCIFASMLLFSFAFYIQSQLGAAPDTIQKWSIIAKSIAASAAGTGFIAYAIAWLRRIYLDDISVERSLERYALDVDRASWSIETLMEMAKQENAEIPEAWIKGVCNDLFVTSTEKEEPTALQALGAMMDVAAGAEIGSNGAKIVLNRKGTKAIADSAK